MRFEKGETAIFAVARTSADLQHDKQRCTIRELGPFPSGVFIPELNITTELGADYLIRHASGAHAFVRDWQLRKVFPAKEPGALIHHDDAGDGDH
jgi:hypothetical protein